MWNSCEIQINLFCWHPVYLNWLVQCTDINLYFGHLFEWPWMVWTLDTYLYFKGMRKPDGIHTKALNVVGRGWNIRWPPTPRHYNTPPLSHKPTPTTFAITQPCIFLSHTHTLNQKTPIFWPLPSFKNCWHNSCSWLKMFTVHSLHKRCSLKQWLVHNPCSSQFTTA